MKNMNRKMKISAITAVSALALSGVAFGSSAFATDTVTATATGTATATATPAPSPVPTISPMPGGGSSDSESSVEIDEQGILDGILGGSQSTLGISGSVGSQEDGTAEVPEADNEVAALDSENASEEASFGEDISAATQVGDNEDVAELSTAASIVTSVTVPEVQAMTADNAAANAMITGVPQK